ncbi:hypothetical protein MQC27_23855, partial [Escherichia coli]|nr:hypothetical protein [Escherichia coli]
EKRVFLVILFTSFSGSLVSRIPGAVQGALPPAFSGIIIASRFNVYTRTGTASLAVSVLGFVVTAPLWIYVSRLVS